MNSHQKIHSCFKLNDHSYLELSQLAKGYAYYSHFRINLRTAQKEEYQISDFLQELKKKNLSQIYKEMNTKRVTHLYFELGFILKNLNSLENEVLAIDLEYLDAKKIKSKPEQCLLKANSFRHMSFEEYEEKFEKVYHELINGNAYQVNLTFPVKINFSKISVDSLIAFFHSCIHKLSAYAHYSYIPLLDEFILSNSPECLFNFKENTVYTMPIKGTVNNSLTNWKQELTSKKNLAELNMITDLMRNDISAINNEISYVDSQYKFLHVSELVHLYSIIKSDLSPSTHLYECINALFPGGSITGAPKKSVMKIIRKIEDYNRGIYCGSTLLQVNGRISASINIRTLSAKLEKQEFIYGTGGGITLNSNVRDEFQEALNKFNSFYSLLT